MTNLPSPDLRTKRTLSWRVHDSAHKVLTMVSQNPVSRRVAQASIDALVTAITLWTSYWLRFDADVPARYVQHFIDFLPPIVLLYLSSTLLFRVYRQVWHYIGTKDSLRIFQSVVWAALLVSAFSVVYSHSYGISRMPLGILIIHPLLVLMGYLGVRIARTLIYHDFSRPRVRSTNVPRRTLLLVGAGRAGMALLKELRQHNEFHVVGFADDNRQLQGRLIEGVPVLGPTTQVSSIVRALSVDEVTLCIPSARQSVISKIATECRRANVKTTTVPSLSEIMLGQLTISRLREVHMEDLLGRNKVSYPSDDKELIEAYRNKIILVTGAGGSIGSEIARQMTEFQPSRLILLDKNENSLHDIGLELREASSNITEVVADIRDLDSVERTIGHWRPDVVFHAAAYKHVPLMEHFPGEAILNNVVGSRNLVEVSAWWGVSRFVLVSTDKAVNPTSVMGASKRIAELIMQAKAKNCKRSRFCSVRFGNVLGSRASVVKIFEKQIREGKTITITHPDIQRYFMTIAEASQLVIQAGSLADSGAIFVLDMGKPVRIVDLAKNMIRLSGLVPEKDVPIKITGLRPGEKLYEELLVDGENGERNTKYSKIFVSQAVGKNGKLLETQVRELESAARSSDSLRIHRLLRDMGIGYRPFAGDVQAISAIESSHGQPGQHHNGQGNNDGKRPRQAPSTPIFQRTLRAAQARPQKVMRSVKNDRR